MSRPKGGNILTYARVCKSAYYEPFMSVVAFSKVSVEFTLSSQVLAMSIAEMDRMGRDRVGGGGGGGGLTFRRYKWILLLYYKL